MGRGTLATALFLLTVLMLLPAGTSCGEPETIEVHSMTVFLDSSESGYYDYMTWDFGDGSGADSRDSADALNPSHTYSSVGTYTIVQTVHSGYRGGTDDVCVRTVEILGPPTVTLVSGGSVIGCVQVEDRSSEEYNPAERPADPAGDGRFLGWMTESGKPYDWDSPVTVPVVLYASWEETGHEEPVRQTSLLMPISVFTGLMAGILILAYSSRWS